MSNPYLDPYRNRIKSASEYMPVNVDVDSVSGYVLKYVNVKSVSGSVPDPDWIRIRIHAYVH